MADIEVYYNNIKIVPAPTVSYQTQILYNNDLAIGYQYDITINGYAMPVSGDSGGIKNVMDKILNIKNIFNSNGAALKVAISGGAPLLYAVDSKVMNINWDPSNNNWATYAPYSVELQCNHLYVGTGLAAISDDIERGDDYDYLNNNLHSPSIVHIENEKIKTFSENLSFNIDDNNFNHMDIYDDITFTSSSTPTTVLSSNYFNITYTLNATGKHDVVNLNDSKTTLPAWEHAKRFVHNRLLEQLSRLNTSINTMMRHGSATSIANLHNNTGSVGIVDVDSSTGYLIFNETIDFDVSESDGTFSVTYNALAKQKCLNVGSVGCSNNALHTVNKKINRTYNANAQIGQNNHEISISIDGEITGLVPGVGPASSAAFIISDVDGYGSFLTVNPEGSRVDKSDNAIQLFNAIFDYAAYDLTPQFKAVLGINASTLAINPSTVIKPSRMSLTKNLIRGTINYSAEYNNKYNCPTNHYSIDISVDEPVPIIAEFVIPNNNLETEQGTIAASGFSVIQKLGTSTAKKINITINGNDQADDIMRCCLGTDGGWNLLQYNYFNLGAFTVPSGINLPVVSPGYVLTSKQKRTTYPRGEFNITLSYTCADVCDIDWS